MLGELWDAEHPPKSDSDSLELPDIEETFEDLDAEVKLPYALELCIDLWRAWNDKGVMPVGGGYLDQPRQWQKLIYLFNKRHNGVVEQRQADQQEQDYLKGLMG